MTTELATTTWDRERIELLKDSYAKGATDAELALFVEVCKRTGLDPFARQVYLIGRWDGRLGREVMQVQTSIDGYRLVAQRSGQYAGQVGPEWCGPDGIWRDVWPDRDPPMAARVGVMRAGFTTPLYRVAHWSEAAQYGKGDKLSPTWARMPALMLAKVAEAAALRAAFPAELSGLYTEGEVGDEPTVAPAPVPTARPAPELPRDDEDHELLGALNVQKLIEFCDRHNLDSAAVVEAGTEGRTRDPHKVRTSEMQAVSAAAKAAKEAKEQPAPEPEQPELPAADDGTVPVDDPSLDGPAPDTGPLCSKAQVGKIKGEYERLSIGDRGMQLAWTATLLDLGDATVTSHNYLTKDQASLLIELLVAADSIEKLDELAPPEGAA